MLESARFRVFLIVRKGRDMGVSSQYRSDPLGFKYFVAGLISVDEEPLSAALSRDRGHVS